MSLRCYDTQFIRTSLTPHVELIPEDFDWDKWVSDERNVALQNGADIGFFECEYNGYFSGHYAFVSRGKEAYRVAVDMLAEMFGSYGAKAIRGLTPVDNRKALWMTRHLGFTSYGTFSHFEKQYELFVMTIDEFYSKHQREMI